MSEYGWVIEGAWSHVQTPDYWVGSSAWSPDHNRALRFVRKQDAEQAASMMLDGLRVRICEHAWACAPEYQQGRAQSAREPQYQDRPTAADSAVGKTNDELEAIRARDAKGLVSGAVEQIGDAVSAFVDRRALLAEVDRLRFEWQVQVSKVIGLELTNNELREELKLHECEGPAHM